MRKTNKADLCHALESDVTSISQLTPFDRSSTVLVQDGMALLQSMNVKAFNFVVNKHYSPLQCIAITTSVFGSKQKSAVSK